MPKVNKVNNKADTTPYARAIHNMPLSRKGDSKSPAVVRVTIEFPPELLSKISKERGQQIAAFIHRSSVHAFSGLGPLRVSTRGRPARKVRFSLPPAAPVVIPTLAGLLARQQASSAQHTSSSRPPACTPPPGGSKLRGWTTVSRAGEILYVARWTGHGRKYQSRAIPLAAVLEHFEELQAEVKARRNRAKSLQGSYNPADFHAWSEQMVETVNKFSA